jgi:hypothetical protein
MANLNCSVNDSNIEFLGLTGSGTVRPADLLVPRWNGERPLCIDVTIVSPLRQGSSGTLGVLKDAATAKGVKHRDACLLNGHDFLPFVASTFGVWEESTLRFLKRLRLRLNALSLIRDDGGAGRFFSRLGFAIQKGISRQLAARL